MNLHRAETLVGTGFFINQNGKLYYATARHTFIKCDSLRMKEYSNYYDNAMIFLSSTRLLIIHISKPKDSCKCLNINKYPDVVVFEMEYGLASKINSVEDFMLPPFQSFGDAEFYGQGFTRDSSSFYFTNPHRTHLPAKTFEIGAFLGDSATMSIDSVDYYFFVTTIKFGSSYKGYSGSPVFLQDSLSKNVELQVFLQVVCKNASTGEIGGKH